MKKLQVTLLNSTTPVLLGVVFITFGLLSDKFLTAANLSNLLVQSSSTAVVGVGMTFVLLTGGVDLSVGACMFIAAAVAGKLVLGGVPFPVALAALIVTGFFCGACNALLVTRFGIVAFIATLGTLYAGRGLGLWITQTRAMNLPESFLQIGTAKVAGVPLPILILTLVVVVAHLTLTRTPFGRHLYAVGQSPEAARKAGLRTTHLVAAVYIISGFCAAIGGVLSLAQLGSVSPTFGTNREFTAIAAAVLGGTSLSGGRGSVFPGTVLGAIFIQSIESGLVIIDADPYLYPLVISAVIFVAIVTDSARQRLLERWGRRPICT